MQNKTKKSKMSKKTCQNKNKQKENCQNKIYGNRNGKKIK